MYKGFSLLELLLTLTVLALITASALPALGVLTAKLQLERTAVSAKSMFHFARSRAILDDTDVYVAWFRDGTSWCLIAGLTLPSNCQESPHTAQYVLRTVSYREFPYVKLVRSHFNRRNHVIFTGGTGLSEGYAGHLLFTALPKFSEQVASMKVILSPIGRSRYCVNGELSGVESCD